MRDIPAHGSRAVRRLRTWTAIGMIAALATGCSSPGPRATTDATPTIGPPATAMPSASTTGTATPGQVTLDPSLPDAKPLPAGIWATTTPGWVLATYEPTVITYDETSGAPSPSRTRQVVYLVAPNGTRYQVLELDATRPLAIRSWTAGQSVAYVEDCGGDAYCSTDTGPTYTLDLATGALALAQVPAGADHIEATLPGSTRLWLQTTKADDPAKVKVFLDRAGTLTTLGMGWEQPQVSPDGAWIAMQRWAPQPDGTSQESTGVIDVASATLAVIPAVNPPAACSPYEWTEDGRLLEYCSNPDGTESWVAIDPAARSWTPTASPLPAIGALSVSHNVLVSPGVWAGLYGTEGSLMWTDADGTVGLSKHGAPGRLKLVDGTGAPILAAYPVAAVGGIVYFSGKRAAIDVPAPTTVVAYDVAADTQAVLLPTPPGGPASGPGLTANQEVLGVTSWVVAR